jgi:alpha-tubulin suppressor-like RCC1 family protein
LIFLDNKEECYVLYRLFLENGSCFAMGWNEHGNCGTGTICPIIDNLEKIRWNETIKMIGSGYGHSFLVS